MTDAPERIWIEAGDDCPYFYGEDELHEAGSPVTEYIRADLVKSLEVESQRLRKALKEIDHGDGWGWCGQIARAALSGEGEP